jgi:hypothetical protein
MHDIIHAHAGTAICQRVIFYGLGSLARLTSHHLKKLLVRLQKIGRGDDAAHRTVILDDRQAIDTLGDKLRYRLDDRRVAFNRDRVARHDLVERFGARIGISRQRPENVSVGNDAHSVTIIINNDAVAKMTVVHQVGGVIKRVMRA